MWAIKAKNGGKFPVAPKKAVEKKAAPVKFYPGTDGPKSRPAGPVKSSKRAPTATLRSSITPGTVCILLAGRFKGCRVVFLKQLRSGMLLVSGPFRVNGVPLRRVDQVYVIATSTKVDVSGVDVSKVNDAYFKRERPHRSPRDEEGFFQHPTEQFPLKPEVVETQSAVDKAILAKLSADHKAYLSARFSLKSGDRPHLMKF